MCADIKVDAPAAVTHTFQLPVASVDYFGFETELAHRNAQKTVTNRVYAQIHNRGIQAATNVTVKLLFCDATPGVPSLPPNFWTAWPDGWTQGPWYSVGPAKTITSISPTRPEILEWDWVPPSSPNQHFCMLMVCDCAADPIPAANKVFDVGALVANEKRVGQKNLHLIDPLPAPWSMIQISAIEAQQVLRFSAVPKDWAVGVLLPKAFARKVTSANLTAGKLTKAQTDTLRRTLGDQRMQLYDPAHFRLTTADKVATITGVPETKGFEGCSRRMGKSDVGARCHASRAKALAGQYPEQPRCSRRHYGAAQGCSAGIHAPPGDDAVVFHAAAG